MKTFLVRNKYPIIHWSHLPDNVFYKGTIPEGYSLGIVPTKGYIIVDVDRHGDVDGFDSIPDKSPKWYQILLEKLTFGKYKAPFNLLEELENTFNYPTKNNGKHYWFKYTGNKELANKPSGFGIDLRTHKGYVVFYPEGDFKNYKHLINNTSNKMNNWLEANFYYVRNKKK